MSQHLLTPPLGWNSFDSFGGYLHEQAALAQLEAFATKLAPHGYDIFVVDIGWYGEYEFKPGTILPVPAIKHAPDTHLDAYGLPLPSKCYFPNGFDRLIARTHELGLKFGVHLMRGVPRKAVELKLPIKGAPGVTAADIADVTSTCRWCHYNYGVNMAKNGAQAWYDSLVAHVASWGVDFIKADDITGYPLEIAAVTEAIAKCGRPIILSLSHGGEADPTLLPVYRQSDLIRITKDIWDDPESIERSFNAWEHWAQHAQPGFWLDLDMIPFGDLQTMSPQPAPGELPNGENPPFCGKGFRRHCELNYEERKTLMTQRALAASPLFLGGDLTTFNGSDLHLMTAPRMLACNRNGIMGTVCYMRGDVQVWHSPHRTKPGTGWLAAFNRNPARCEESITLTADRLGFSPMTKLYDVWTNEALCQLSDRPHFKLPPLGSVFLEYTDSCLETKVGPPESPTD